VEEGHEFGHLRHLHAPRHEGARAAAQGQSQDQQQPARARGGGTDEDGGGDGEPHAHHAEDVALPRGGGMGEAAQRQDEEDA
jgi:hypothetical protein